MGAADLHLSIEGMGMVLTLTQAGYALGSCSCCRSATDTTAGH